jgi:cytochrome c-type biogenesis protein CcmE
VDLTDADLGPESADAGPDPALVPRTRTEGTAPPRKRRRWGVAVMLAVVLTAGAIILFQGLSNASVYFCNANEVGVKSDCSPGSRFRLQGTVDQGTVQKEGEVLTFSVTYAGRTIPVRYVGDPGGIFKENIPVVVEGRMGDDGTFAGDRILVKHTEQYREKNPGNVKDYDE